MSTEKPAEFVKPELASHEPPAKKPPKIQVPLDEQAAKWKQVYDGADDKIKEWTEKKKLARDQLVAIAQAAVAQNKDIEQQAHDNGMELVSGGKKLGTITVKKTTRLNTGMLKEKEPTIYEQFAYVTETVEFRSSK